MDRYRYKKADGDTDSVIRAIVSWNTKKIVQLHKKREESRNQREIKEVAEAKTKGRILSTLHFLQLSMSKTTKYLEKLFFSGWTH